MRSRVEIASSCGISGFLPCSWQFLRPLLRAFLPLSHLGNKGPVPRHSWGRNSSASPRRAGAGVFGAAFRKGFPRTWEQRKLIFAVLLLFQSERARQGILSERQQTNPWFKILNFPHLFPRKFISPWLSRLLRLNYNVLCAKGKVSLNDPKYGKVCVYVSVFLAKDIYWCEITLACLTCSVLAALNLVLCGRERPEEILQLYSTHTELTTVKAVLQRCLKLAVTLSEAWWPSLAEHADLFGDCGGVWDALIFMCQAGEDFDLESSAPTTKLAVQWPRVIKMSTLARAGVMWTTSANQTTYMCNVLV